MKDINSLAHTKWNCKYHIVFAPKYRRQAIFGGIKKDIGEILRKASKNPEAAVAFYAKMVLDKNYNHLTEYGIQGKHYDINPDGTYKALIPQDTSPFKREAMNGWAWRNASLQLYEKVESIIGYFFVGFN